eukprot:g2272.t1
MLRAADPNVLNTYKVWLLFDVTIALGTVVLLACYGIARHLGHVGTFCDISSLVVHLPERILFRLNFAVVGCLLAVIALPIHDVISSRVPASSGNSCCWRFMPKVAAFFQVVSGIGVILVGACGPSEILAVHLIAAVMGFGGSAVAQIMYNFLLYNEESPSSAAKCLFRSRCLISFLFLAAAVLLGLGEFPSGHPILPEPAEHIFEWSMWFCLLSWYATFRWDMKTFVLASVTTSKAKGHHMEGYEQQLTTPLDSSSSSSSSSSSQNNELAYRQYA